MNHICLEWYEKEVRYKDIGSLLACQLLAGEMWNDEYEPTSHLCKIMTIIQ